MIEELLKLKNDASSLVLQADSLEELNAIKLDFLGKNGKLTECIKGLRSIPQERRSEVGKLANEIKETVESLVGEKEKGFGKIKRDILKKEFVDINLPGIKPALGHLHLISQAIDEITQIFGHIGFERVRYPEVEWDYYAFTALNFPQNHPARDDWETFFIAEPEKTPSVSLRDELDSDMSSSFRGGPNRKIGKDIIKEHPDKKLGQIVLTPHTSSGQVREMLKTVKSASGTEKLAIKMLNIAKCYRRQSDISHTQMFHQFEGLVVGENISVVNLKGVLDYFVKSYFGESRKSRIRPYHFQFTEPSFEVDVSCGVCNGRGCKLCKAGWLELGGAGMVHPNVLKNGRIDPKKHTGFAFGWGIERVLMMKENMQIDDLRLLYSNNLNFLEQF